MTYYPAHRFEEHQPDWYRFLDRPRLPQPTSQSLEQLARSSILVTGAGGSIGSALSLGLAALNPRKLVLLDASEQAIHLLTRALHEARLNDQATLYLGSVHDRPLLDEIFAQHQPELIFHAAAHKHVPLLEDHPLAAIHNNVCGTLALVDSAVTQQRILPRIVLLSTDKASNPISILGATKRLAETIILTHGGIVVRLANVLGSEGSVVQSFLQSLGQGAALNITDPQAERYFLTLEESVDLLLSAALTDQRGILLAPRLSTPHKIIALAHFLISVDVPQQSLPIQFSTLRPGEKLTETLWGNDESPASSNVPGCISITPAIANHGLEGNLARLQSATHLRDIALALDVMRDLVPGYKPSNRALTHARIKHEECNS